jgi:hypothetical protein
MIQEDSLDFPEDRNEVFLAFLLLLLESHLNTNNNDGNILLKMKHYWEYFSSAFDEGLTYYRMVKKAESLSAYEGVIAKILQV